MIEERLRTRAALCFYRSVVIPRIAAQGSFPIIPVAEIKTVEQPIGDADERIGNLVLGLRGDDWGRRLNLEPR